jgi:protein-S-isoprenylcysteine O-methyltransferase Ste14
MKQRPILSAGLLIGMGAMAFMHRRPHWIVPCIGAILLIGGLYHLFIALRARGAQQKPVEKPSDA